MRITAILASRNRREKTLACLRSYLDQAFGSRVTLEAVLVDDGSTDGTAGAVKALGPFVTVINGTGNLYWAASMALAEQHALQRSPEYVLWLNDDVVLDHDALSRLLDVSHGNGERCIVVGALRDPLSGELTYSGVRRRGLHPLRVERVCPGDQPLAVEMFNGNVVLVPAAASAAVGPIDGKFAHAEADFDYGLRAVRCGVQVFLAPGTVGTCPRGLNEAPWLDRSVPVRERARLLLGPKGRPPRSSARYLRRHGGHAWLIFWLFPYVKFALATLRGAVVSACDAASIKSKARG